MANGSGYLAGLQALGVVKGDTSRSHLDYGRDFSACSGSPSLPAVDEVTNAPRRANALRPRERRSGTVQSIEGWTGATREWIWTQIEVRVQRRRTRQELVVCMKLDSLAVVCELLKLGTLPVGESAL